MSSVRSIVAAVLHVYFYNTTGFVDDKQSNMSIFPILSVLAFVDFGKSRAIRSKSIRYLPQVGREGSAWKVYVGTYQHSLIIVPTSL